MFADPQSVTINAVAKSLARTSMGVDAGAFASAADGLTLKVNHKYTTTRRRSFVRLDVSRLSSDPFVPTTNRPFSMSLSFIMDVPLLGFSVTEQTQNLKGLTDWLGVAGNQNKLVNAES